VREPGSGDLADEVGDPRGWRRRGDQRLGRHSFGPCGADEGLVDIGAVVSAVPIEFERKLDQYRWPELTAIPVGLLAPSMKSPLAPDPSLRLA
jgi:hypothetical protein